MKNLTIDDARFSNVPVDLCDNVSETIVASSPGSHNFPALSNNERPTFVPCRSLQIRFLKRPKAHTRRSSSEMLNFEAAILFLTKPVRDTTCGCLCSTSLTLGRLGDEMSCIPRSWWKCTSTCYVGTLRQGSHFVKAFFLFSTFLPIFLSSFVSSFLLSLLPSFPFLHFTSRHVTSPQFTSRHPFLPSFLTSISSFLHLPSFLFLPLPSFLFLPSSSFLPLPSFLFLPSNLFKGRKEGRQAGRKEGRGRKEEEGRKRKEGRGRKEEEGRKRKEGIYEGKLYL